ncbi:MAG TPA: DNA mismatch repair endonuclease MutL [Bacteroidetes bacterium]|nr:DNA mismatch repair endonuclease MutL [Bacteroidota bacterium]
MSDIIRLLPDSVANQIAAGEVIQRPASVVKELMENAIDAGSNRISVHVINAGKTLIRVVDDGCGMSETDARLAFERHATSKIRKAEDLFSIRTMGFRGEALASVAAVAQVELKTKRKEDELGTYIVIASSKVESQEPVACPEGSNFAVKNLFYNIPARRKFLKSNTTELKHIVVEFHRIVLTHPGISFNLRHNESDIYQLPVVSSLRQRIVNVFGKTVNQHLIPIHTDTSVVKIHGFIGKPEFAKKTFGEQFFFTNGRFMKHPYFHRAITEAYLNILPKEAVPSYFIYFETNPEKIDINIHPTKTEIKFEDERSVWQILYALVKEALGKFNIVPSLDFDNPSPIEIPVIRRGEKVSPPEVPVNPDFNPFEPKKEMQSLHYGDFRTRTQKEALKHWEKMYEGLEQEPWKRQQEIKHNTTSDIQTKGISFLQFKHKYILFAVKSGLMIVDQKRAHERILFEEFLQRFISDDITSQQRLFPVSFNLDPADLIVLEEIKPDIEKLGISWKKEKDNSISITGIPGSSLISDPAEMIRALIVEYKISESDPTANAREKIARALAQVASIPYGKPLTAEEMRDLTDRLFACKEPGYTAGGKPVFYILPLTDIEKQFE